MQHDPGSPTSWLRFARSDLAVARQKPGAEVLPETLCFHAQQATEKTIKAVLVHVGVPVPKTHNIERLVDLLPCSIERVPLLIQATLLSDYAVIFRYPSDEEPITEEDLAKAIGTAELVVGWAEKMVA